VATQSFFYSNNAVDATIGNAGSLAIGGTTLFVTGSAPTGYPASFPFRLTLGGTEVVHVASGAGTSGTPWVISRGQDGTTAQAWPQGTLVQHRATQGDIQLSRLHEGSVAADLPHGLPAGAWATSVWGTIQETVTAASQATVSIGSIPGTYKHLMLIINGRGNSAALQADDVLMTLNGDAGAHYSYVTTSCTNISGGTTGALGAVSDFTTSAVTNWPVIRINCSLAGAAVNAGGGTAFIPNYSGSTFGKMFWSQSAAGNGTTAMVDYRSRMGWWTPVAQAAITSMLLTAPGGSTFKDGTFVGLYGLS
jgi:hypothetical protein